jgi:SecD/SecF fusion protein
MHKNGLVKFIAIVFTLISILQISYTYVVNKVEKDAENYAISKINSNEKDFLVKRDQLQRIYLDSVSDISVFGFTTYKGAKAKELNKGLDLKGGINVILQISVKDILKGLAENTNDPAFNRAIDRQMNYKKALTILMLNLFLLLLKKMNPIDLLHLTYSLIER